MITVSMATRYELAKAPLALTETDNAAFNFGVCPVSFDDIVSD